MGFFKSLPREVEESAMVDGCSRFGAIVRMVLPLSVPGLLTVVIFALTLVIQEFVYSLTFISSVQRMTVSVVCRVGWCGGASSTGARPWARVGAPASPLPC